MAWHRLETADATIFESAPQLLRYRIELDVPPARVWESLASDESLAAWPLSTGLSVKVRWTAPRPFGIGTTRDVVLPLGVITVRERFFRWDEGAGYSFFVEAANRRGLRRLAENYVIEPRGTGSLLLWTVAIEPSPRAGRLGALTAPMNKLAFGRTAAAAKKYFAANP